MVPPYVSSAQLAQELRRAAAAAASGGSASEHATTWSKSRSYRRDYGYAPCSDSESPSELDDDSDEDDGSDLIEEHFLPPLSAEAIRCKADAYARVLSPLGQQYATELPLRVLAVATGFTESLTGDIHTIRALDGRKELAVSHSRLDPHQVHQVVAFLERRRRAHEYQGGGISNAARMVAAGEPGAGAPGTTSSSGTATPAERAVWEAYSARAFGDALLSGLSSLATTPRRTRSPSPPPAVERDAREQLLQWYQFTAAGQNRQNTALDRLLDGVQAARAATTAVDGAHEADGGEGGAREAEAAQPGRPRAGVDRGGAGEESAAHPVLRVPALDGVGEFAFELVPREVHAEDDQEDGSAQPEGTGGSGVAEEEAEAEAEDEAAIREQEAFERGQEARRSRAQRELVGR